MSAVFHGTRDDLRNLLASLPAVLSGRASDPLGLARQMQLRLGVGLLSKVQQDYITKARGGTGTDGVTWRKLSPKTIAARRITGSERKAAGIKGARVRGLLTPAQDKRWRQIYARTLARNLGRGANPRDAAALAARTAWAVLKAEGAQTRLATFGGRQVEILRDTGRMLRSLSPGVEDRPSGEAEQRFDLAPGRVIVGSKVPYFGRQDQHRQVLPRGDLPPAWWTYLLGVYARGLVQVLTRLLPQMR